MRCVLRQQLEPDDTEQLPLLQQSSMPLTITDAGDTPECLCPLAPPSTPLDSEADDVIRVDPDNEESPVLVWRPDEPQPPLSKTDDTWELSPAA
jgi:hypothetical protein